MRKISAFRELSKFSSQDLSKYGFLNGEHATIVNKPTLCSKFDRRAACAGVALELKTSIQNLLQNNPKFMPYNPLVDRCYTKN